MQSKNVIDLNNRSNLGARPATSGLPCENMLRQASGVAKLVDMYLDNGVNTVAEKEIIQQACGAISSLIDVALHN
jgi:hypothetical protein